MAPLAGFTLARLAQACAARDHAPRSCFRRYREQGEKTRPVMAPGQLLPLGRGMRVP